MKTITVYYAGQMHHEYLDPKTFGEVTWELLNDSREIYNGCYIQLKGFISYKDGWYRADQTPVLDADVPKELKLLQLIST